jgi:hypothetical protein
MQLPPSCARCETEPVTTHECSTKPWDAEVVFCRTLNNIQAKVLSTWKDLGERVRDYDDRYINALETILITSSPAQQLTAEIFNSLQRIVSRLAAGAEQRMDM